MFKKSLRNRITALFLLVAIVPLMIISLFQVFYFRNTQSQNARSSEMSIAQLNAASMDLWFRNHIANAELLVKKTPAFQQGDMNQIRTILAQAINNDAAAENYIFVDIDGKGTDEKGGAIDISDRQYFQQAKSQLKTVVSDVLKSKITGNNIVVIAVPVTDSKSFEGLLAITVNVSNLLDITNNIKVEQSGYGYIVSPSGTLITYIDKNSVGKKLGEVFSPQEASVLEKAVFSGNDGYAEYNGSSGQQTAAYSVVPSTGWRIVVTAPSSEVYADVIRATTVSAIFIVICIIGVIILAMMFSDQIVKPILNISSSMKKVAEGYLNVKLRAASEDEIGKLTDDINHTIEELRDIIGDIKGKAGELNDSATNLSAISEQIAASSQGIAQAMQDTATGVTQQANDLSDISAAVEDFGSSLDDVYNSLNAIKDSNDTTSRLSEQGSISLNNLIASINEVRDFYASIKSDVGQLSESINNISDITNMISNIANKTRMLSLNASIEASRSGDNGRGFTAVAYEIRSLAENSKQLTNDISNVVNDVLSNTTNVVKATGEMETKLRVQLKLATQTIAAFNEIMDSINRTVPRVDEAYDRADSMISVKDSIARRIESASAVAEEIAASAQEIAASAQEMSGATEEIASTAAFLLEAANELTEKVSGFTL